MSEAHWTLSAVLMLLGQVQGCTLALALLTRMPAVQPGQRVAGRWLALLLMALSMALSVPLLQELGVWMDWPRTVLLLSGLPLMFGPLLYLHVAAKTGAAGRPRWPWWLANSALPVGYYLMILPWLLADHATLQAVLSGPADASSRFSLLPTLKHLSFVGYSLAALIVLRRYQRQLRDQLAELQRYVLPWLRLLVGCSLLLSLGLAVLWISGWSGLRHDLAFALTLVALIFAAGYHGLRATPVFVSDANIVDTERARDPSPPLATSQRKESAAQETRALLGETELAALLEKLDGLGGREELLFEHDLSLPRLATALRCTAHQLSWALNQVRGQSFYDLINGLRVAAVQQRLLDPAQAHVPVLDLALGCGFSNKTTFYKAFREVTGATPQAWRRQAIKRPGG